jgi:hypothetical protein
MPDALAALIVILGWLCASRDPNAPGSPLLWLAAVAACLTHSTFIAVLGASFLAALLVLKFGELAWAEFWKRLLAFAAAAAITVGTQLIANNFFIGKAAYSPRSSAFLYASLNEDGLVEPWLQENCPSDPRVKELCEIAPLFPRDSQLLLWSPKSPFKKTVWRQRHNRPGVDWDRQLGIAARGALLTSPVSFVKHSATATLEQFLSFSAMDDECPEICMEEHGTLQAAFRLFRPSIKDRVNQAPQIRGDLPRGSIRAVTRLNSIVGVLGLILLLPIALIRKDVLASALVLALLSSLILNAFVTGSLSDVHDRYQSRLIWLCSVVCLLLILRWRAAGRASSTSQLEPRSA